MIKPNGMSHIHHTHIFLSFTHLEEDSEELKELFQAIDGFIAAHMGEQPSGGEGNQESGAPSED